jgi:lysophospholipase L1-like esterase
MIHHIAKLLLAPVLWAQVKSTRKRALALPEPADAREGVQGQGKSQLKLLIFGDSSAAGVGVSSQAQALSGSLTRELLKREPNLTVQWKVLAKSGVSSRAALELLDGYEQPHDIAIVLVGVNDIVDQVPLPLAIKAREQLVRRLRKQCGVQQVVLIGLPPVHQFPLLRQPLRYMSGAEAKRLDRAVVHWVQQYAHATLAREGLRVTHVPIHIKVHAGNMAADGFHPGPTVYATCAAQIAKVLLEAEPSAHIVRNKRYEFNAT